MSTTAWSGAAVAIPICLAASPYLARLTLMVVDHEQHRLPNRLVYPMAAGAVVLLFAAAASRDDWSDLLRAGEAGAAVFAVLYVIMLVSPRSFGYGDARLGGVLGLYLGFDGWAAVYYGILGGFVLGAGVALVLLAARRASRKTA